MRHFTAAIAVFVIATLAVTNAAVYIGGGCYDCNPPGGQGPGVYTGGNGGGGRYYNGGGGGGGRPTYTGNFGPAYSNGGGARYSGGGGGGGGYNGGGGGYDDDLTQVIGGGGYGGGPLVQRIG